MIHEFTKEKWNDVGGSFVLLFDKDEPGKHLIQVWKKNENGDRIVTETTIMDKENSVVLSINRDPFDGYAVLR